MKWLAMLPVLASASLLLVLGSLVADAASQSATGKQPVDTRLVFVRNHLCKWNDCGKGEIAIMNLDGSGFRRLLANNGVTDESPSWSPHKDRIAFTRFAVPSELWVMDANGHSQRRLRTPRGHTPLGPDWSPSGRTIVFAADTKQGFALWTVDVRTGKLKQLTSGLFMDRSPAWSPDGTRIAFSRDGRILTMRLRDHRRVRLAEGLAPRWSPDGRRIAYWRSGDVWLMNADGKQKHRLGLLGVDGFTWSADGRWVVFNAGNGGGDLFSIRPNGTARHVIRRESGGPNGWHANYPDG
jgi:TolB protein